MRNKMFKKMSSLLLSFLMIASVCAVNPLHVSAMDSTKGIEIEVPHTTLDQAVEDAKNSGATAVKDNVQEKNSVTEVETDYNNQITVIQKIKSDLDDYNQKKADYDIKKAKYDADKAQYDHDYAQYLLDYKAYEDKLAEEKAALAAALAEYEKHKNEPGYLSSPHAKTLVYDSEPDAILTTETDGEYVSAAAVDNAFSKDTANYNNKLLQLDNISVKEMEHPGDISSSAEFFGNVDDKIGWTTTVSNSQPIKWTTVLLKRGQSVTATYTNLENSYYNGKKISKIVFKYTLTTDSQFQNDTGYAWLGIFTDPTLGVFASAYTGNTEKATSIFMKNEFSFYDQDGQAINFDDALLSVASLNREHNSIELAKDYSGEFIKISGSSIDEKNGMIYSTPTLNFKQGEGGALHTMYKRASEPGSGWDAADAANSWYGAGAVLMKGPDNYVTLGATSAVNVIPLSEMPTVPGKDNEEGKKPNIWYSLNGKVRAVGLPEITAKEPTKPTEPIPPTEPVKPNSTFHYHYDIVYERSTVEKKVTKNNGTDIQGQTVDTGSDVVFELTTSAIPANHEPIESVVFEDTLPDGYVVDLASTKQASADYDVTYDANTRLIKFTANTMLLASINADKTVASTIPSPKIIGKVTKEGTKYENTFRLTLDNTYTAESKPVVVYTPSKPKKDVFLTADLNTTIDGKTVHTGDQLTYQITYTNTTGDTRDVTITDTIPAHTTFVDADTNGIENNGTLTWNIIGVEEGKTVVVSFRVKVNDDVNGEAIKNTAHTNDGVNEFDTNETTNPTPTKPKKDVHKVGDVTTSIDGNAVKADQQLTYTIQYINTTNEKRTVSVTDVIPEHTEYVDGTATLNGTYDAATKTITWKAEDVAVGDKVIFQFNVKVASDVNGETIVNKADVRDGFNDVTTNVTKNPTPSHPVKEVFAQGDDTINIDGKPVVAGQELTYQIAYINTSGTVQDVEITDHIPMHTTYVDGSADRNGVLSGDTLTWNITSVAAGDTVTVKFKVKVNEEVNGQIIENTAHTKDGLNEFDTNETTNPTPTKPKKDVFTNNDLITSIDSKPVKANQELTYQILYINTTGTTQDVTITDIIPDLTAYIVDSASDQGVYSAADRKLTWTKQVASGDTWTVMFRVKVDSAANGQVIENAAHIKDGLNEFDTNETTNPTPTKPTKDVFTNNDLITSIDSKAVVAEQELTYKIHYVNTTGEAQDVVITDTIPEFTSYVNGSADENGTYVADKKTITWTKQVSAGDTWAVTFKVKVDADVDGEEIKNTGHTKDGVNEFDTNETTNPTPTKPKKDVYTGVNTTSIDGNAVIAGQELTYAITYTNTTGITQDVEITDHIPMHTTYVDGSADQDGTLSGNTLTWNITSVAAGDTVTVKFKVKVNEEVNGEEIKNIGHTKDGVNEFDTNETTNPTPTKPKKDVYTGVNTTSIDGNAVIAGQELTYVITYTNTTGKDRNVTITDVIPAYTEYVINSATDGGIYDGIQRNITWTKQVSAGDTWTVTFKVKVDADMDGKVIENTAHTNDGVNEFDTNETTNPTPTKPKKDVHEKGKTDVSIDNQEIQPGQEITYTIRYINTTDTKKTVEVKDVIPEHTEYVDGTATLNGTYDAATKTITWKAEDVAVGDKVIFQFNVKVASDVNGETIVNKADVRDGFNDVTTNVTKNTTPKKVIPKTADSTHIITYVYMLGSSGLLLVLELILRRKFAR